MRTRRTGAPSAPRCATLARSRGTSPNELHGREQRLFTPAELRAGTSPSRTPSTWRCVCCLSSHIYHTFLRHVFACLARYELSSVVVFYTMVLAVCGQVHTHIKYYTFPHLGVAWRGAPCAARVCLYVVGRRATRRRPGHMNNPNLVVVLPCCT